MAKSNKDTLQAILDALGLGKTGKQVREGGKSMSQAEKISKQIDKELKKKKKKKQFGLNHLKL